MRAAFALTSQLSPQAWQRLLAEVMPPQGAWTEEQYLVFTDHTNRLIEFTDDRLEPLPMPTDKHQAIFGLLFKAFGRFVEARGGTVRFSGLRLKVRDGKFREPDLLLVLSANDPRRQNRFWTGADLALEVVSRDKPHRVLVEKRGDYAEGGVAEYWILHPEDETITVLRLDGEAYFEAGVYRRGDSAASALLAGFAMDVSTVFDAD